MRRKPTLYELNFLWATPAEFAKFSLGIKTNLTRFDEISFRSVSDERAVLRAEKEIKRWRDLSSRENFLIPLFLIKKDLWSGYENIHNYTDDPIQITDEMRESVELNQSARKEGRLN